MNRTTLPRDFALTPARRAFAEGAGVDADQQFDHFMAYHAHDERGMADWDAAWRYWVRVASEVRGRR